MAASAKTQSGKVELLARLAAWTVRYLFRFSLLASALMAAICISFLLYARKLPDAHQFRRDALANLAASCAEIAIGTFFAALVGRSVAKIKLRELSRPILALIQRLQIDGKLSPEGARRSVVCAVALLSESNVRKSIEPGAGEPHTQCPICTQLVEQEMDKCIHCELPKTIWNDAAFVKSHEDNLAPEKKI